MKNTIKVLGAYGGRSAKGRNSALLIGEKILIDAGDVIDFLGDETSKIDHIFITHAHWDHLADIPFMIDTWFETRQTPLTLYALPQTLEAIHQHLFNGVIWPDFCTIALTNGEPALRLQPLVLETLVEVEGVCFTPIKTPHTTSSCGYIVNDTSRTVLVSADTASCIPLWEVIHQDERITTLVTEISFPSRLASLARLSSHMTPITLFEEMKGLKRDICICITHIKPLYYDEIIKEVKHYFNDRVIILDNNQELPLC